MDNFAQATAASDAARLQPLWQLPRTRKEAVAAGLKRYFTGQLCPKSHMAARVLSGSCVECSRERTDAWVAANKERMTEYLRNWHLENRDRRLVQLRAWNESKREYLSEKALAWRSENGDRSAVYQRNYRSRKRAAKGDHTVDDVAAIRASQKDKCGYCNSRLGGKGEVDHIVALNSGGSNDRRNLQLLCLPCNRKKSDRDPLEFARSGGRLL